MILSCLPAVRREQAPDVPALSDDTHGTLSNAALADMVDGYARHFADRELGRGDILAIKLTNRIELVVALFVAWWLDAALTSVNPALTAAQTGYQLLDAGAALVVVEAETDTTELPRSVTAVTPGRLAGPTAGLPELPREPVAGEEDLALVIYTGDTTGRPKGVELLRCNVEAMTAAMAESMELAAAGHSLLILPLVHVNGIVVGVLSPLWAGGRTSVEIDKPLLRGRA
jgi:acyl-CoA synthetase (AMP-forming)/AMP-acid ligase II